MRYNAITEKLVVTGFIAGLQFTKNTSLNKSSWVTSWSGIIIILPSRFLGEWPPWTLIGPHKWYGTACYTFLESFFFSWKFYISLQVMHTLISSRYQPVHLVATCQNYIKNSFCSKEENSKINSHRGNINFSEWKSNST